MFALITTMGLILGSWFVLFLMLSGIGMPFQRLLGKQAQTGTLWLDSFWLGFGVMLFVLQLWHFVFPVNDLAFILLLLIGLISIGLYRHTLLGIVRRFKQYKLFWGALGFVIVWFVTRAVEMPTAYDTGFRDIQAVMWIDTYPIVPGLNNLFSSLAFNHSSYLYNALLDVSIWSGRAYHIAPGLLFFVFSIQSVWSGFQLLRNRHQVEQVCWSEILAFLLLPYLFFNTLRFGGLTHFLTDTVVDIVGFLCAMYLLDFLQFYRLPDHDDRYLIWRLAFLIAVGFTLKQSFIVFGLAMGVLVLVVWIVRGGLQGGLSRLLQIGLPVLFFGLAMMIPWMARGVITSGYVAYPQSIGRFEVDWAESPELLEERQLMLATNTRLRFGEPDEVLSSWGWLRPWLNTLLNDYANFMIPAGLTILSILVYAVGAWQNRHQKTRYGIGFWVLIPMILMIVVWFVTAPNIKYIRYVMWITSGTAVVLAILAWSRLSSQWRIYAVFAVWGICMLYFVYLIGATSAWGIAPTSDNGLQVRPQPPIKVVVTESGLELNTPDSHINQCWDIPLPCTPVASLRIYERVPGELRHGFGLIPKSKP